MRLRNLATVFASLSLISSFAHADILLRSGSDVCSNISGKWSGNGNVEALGGAVSCGYYGMGTISKVQSNGSFTMDVNLGSSSSICPDQQLTLSGVCSKGKIKLTTSSAKLDGDLKTPTHAEMHGVVSIDVKIPWGHKTVDATVNQLLLDKITN